MIKSNRMPQRLDCAFTLIELLVVIVTITILASVLLPTQAGTKIGSKSLQCLNNLKQLTVGALMYQSDNGTIAYVNINNLWITDVLSQQPSVNIRLCPFAAQPVAGAIPNAQGTANNAWIFNVNSNPNDPNSPLVTTNGSYGLNGWLYKYNAIMSPWINPADTVNFFPSAAAIKHPSQTPEFVDSLWPDLWPYQGGIGDNHNGAWELYADNNNAAKVSLSNADQGMPRCCIARHGSAGPIGGVMRVAGTTQPLWNGGVNLSCADGHVEPTTLEGLWYYYWNANAIPAARPPR